MIEDAPFRDPFMKSGINAGSWIQWITKLTTIAGSVSDSGTTANRPTKSLFVGRSYFDTTLGYPIFIKSLGPTVWVDANGATV